jgi:hypothetical protein
MLKLELENLTRPSLADGEAAHDNVHGTSVSHMS